MFTADNLNFNHYYSRDIRADEQLFEQLSYSRKTESNRTVIELARLIILNYAPNVKAGTENMLALLLNMNELWEQLCACSAAETLKKDEFCATYHGKAYVAQIGFLFWMKREI